MANLDEFRMDIDTIIDKLRELRKESQGLSTGMPAGFLGNWEDWQNIVLQIEPVIKRLKSILNENWTAGGPQELKEMFEEVGRYLGLNIEQYIRANALVGDLIEKQRELAKFREMSVERREQYRASSGRWAARPGLAPEPNMAAWKEEQELNNAIKQRFEYVNDVSKAIIIQTAEIKLQILAAQELAEIEKERQQLIGGGAVAIGESVRSFLYTREGMYRAAKAIQPLIEPFIRSSQMPGYAGEIDTLQTSFQVKYINAEKNNALDEAYQKTRQIQDLEQNITLSQREQYELLQRIFRIPRTEIPLRREARGQITVPESSPYYEEQQRAIEAEQRRYDEERNQEMRRAARQANRALYTLGGEWTDEGLETLNVTKQQIEAMKEVGIIQKSISGNYHFNNELVIKGAGLIGGQVTVEEVIARLKKQEIDYQDAINERMQRYVGLQEEAAALEPGKGPEIPIQPSQLTPAQRRAEAEAFRLTRAQALLEPAEPRAPAGFSLAGMLGIGGGERAVENVTARMKEMGYQITDLNRVTTESTTGVTRWIFEIGKGTGVTRLATIATDKYGSVLQDMGTRFRGFFSAIARDITKVIQWGVAAGVVYGSIRKLNELIKESIQLQTKLADIQVALGGQVSNLSSIFDTAAQVSREYGTSVAGVIDGYLLAYRAAGQYSDEAQRTVVATELLRDSMMLAKLSGMSQAQALDHLTASLRQLGMPLTDATVLLDKWVAVTKVANVDLGTLAEGFSIMSAAASGVGINVDRLNAVIAAFAEATGYSGTEVANAIRGFIAGFQTDQAEVELARYGIAIRDTNGDLLDFTEVLDDVASKFAAGIISEEQLSRIANVMGGGWRRGAQLMTLFKNWGRVSDIYTASVTASGDAEAALALKMDTVQTALQNLANAFSQLARALGQEGGFLDLIQNGVLFLTRIVDGVTSLTRTLGKAIPVILAFIAAWKLMGSGPVQTALAGMGFGARTLDVTGQNLVPLGLGQILTMGMGNLIRGAGRGMGNWATRFGQPSLIPGMSMGGASFAGGALGGVISSLATGDIQRFIRSRGTDVTSGARAGVTVASSIAASLITLNPMIGTAIGTAIGQMFIQEATEGIGEMRPAFAAVIQSSYRDVTGRTPEEAGTTGRTPEDIYEEARSLILTGRVTAGLQLSAQENSRLWGVIPLPGEGARARFEREHQMVAGQATPAQVQGYQTQMALEVLAGRTSAGEAWDVIGGELARDLLAAGLADPELRRVAGELLDAAKAIEDAAAAQEGFFDVDSPFYAAIQRSQGISAPITGPLVAAERTERYQDFTRGLLTSKDWTAFNRTVQQSIGNVDLFYAALGDSAEATLGVTSASQAITELTELIFDLNDEQTQLLVAAATNVGKLRDAFEAIPSPANLAAYLEGLQQYKDLLVGTQQGLQYQHYEIPAVQYVAEGTTRAQMEEFERRGQEMSRRIAEQMAPNDPIAQSKIIESWGETAYLCGVSFMNVLGHTIKGIAPEVMQQLQEEMGLTFQGGQMNWNVQVLGQQEWGTIPTQQMADAMRSWLIGKGVPESQLEPTMHMFINGQTHQTQTIMANDLVMQLLMRDLIDVNEKQLEGVFNLPADMAALVPMTGQLYFSTSPIAQGGGEGWASWADDLTGSADALDNSAAALTDAADSLGRSPLWYRGHGLPVPENAPLTPTPTATPEDLTRVAEYQANLERERIAAQVNWFRQEHGIGAENQEPATLEGRGIPTARPWGTTPTTTGDVWNEIVDKWNNMMSSQFPAVDQAITKINSWIDSLTSSLLFPYRGVPLPADGGGNMYSPRPANLKPLEDMMPQSIPITTKVTLNNQNIVYVDGQKILDALLKREHVDFSNAKRRTGTVAYDVSY